MGTGQEFAKKLGTVGCVLVLAASVIFTVLLFTARGGEAEGYVPPRDSAYYAAHPEELAEELRTNLLPGLDAGDAQVTLADGKILVTVPADTFDTVRLSVTRYYDEDLFIFEKK